MHPSSSSHHARARRSCCAGLVLLTTTASLADFVWLECEQRAEADFKWKQAGAEKSHLLSADRWLIIENRTKVPPEGFNVSYSVNVPKAATYSLWLRIGFEWIRPSVLWRFDEGQWFGVGVPPKKGAKSPSKWAFDLYRRTTNLKELGFWNEVAWLRLGSQELTVGAHTLHLKFVEGRVENPLLALDALCLIDQPWTPEGKLKPGQHYEGELDRQAATQVYKLPKARGSARASVRLTGPWQVARYDDPNMDENPYEPVNAIPKPEDYQLTWIGVNVPGALWQHDELAFAHRVIYRTKVDVPAEHRGRAFRLHFSGTNWIASVIVNGNFSGARRSVWIPWDLDLTEFIEPGKVNELAVGIKGPYYAYDTKHYGDGSLENMRNRPYTYQRNAFWVAPIYPSTKGDGDGYQHGIVNPVTLVSMGDAYTDDVFIKPSVQRKELVAEVTVRNTGDADRKLTVLCEAVHDGTNRVEKTLAPVSVAVAAKATQTVTVNAGWENPKLWWPKPKPDLYRLRTKLLAGEKEVDVSEELFGFREVTVDGPSIRLNGVRRNFWNWVDVAGGQITKPEEWAERFRAEGNRFMRFSHGRKITAALPTREQRLEFYDRNGIPGRLCSMIDGMFISFALGDRVRNGKETRFVVNEPVWQNFREHIAQLTKAYRNHPSVLMYQIENELVYINGMNRYGSFLPQIEAEMMEVYQAGYANDPTRPYTVGGGGDLRHAEGFGGKRLEINCPHYPRAAEDYYPNDAYEVSHYSNKIGRWPWDRQNPWVPGESLYASEKALGSYCDGPRVFRSTKNENEGKAKFVRMMYEGYRWAGVAGFFPWCNLSDTEDGQKVFSDLSAIPRKRTWRLHGGRENKLHYKVMNDTLSAEPVTFEWRYAIAGKRVAGDTVTLNIEPGFGKEQWLSITPPAADARVEGVLKLKVSQPGAPDFVDEVSIPVLPAVAAIKSSVPLLVYDTSGKVTEFMMSLRVAGRGFETLDSLSALKGKSGMLIIGPDTLSAGEAFGADLLRFAVAGNQVVCLEQEYPPAGANVSAPLKSTTRFGGYAHPQALGTPLFRDLGRDDFSDWSGDAPTYKHAYLKPKGARSLVECGPNLPYSALVEMGAGKGMLVFCQLRVGAKLGVDPAAEVLLRNLIETYAGRKPSTAVAAIYAPENQLLIDKIIATGVLAERVDSLAEALDVAKYRVVAVDATAKNLAELNKLRARADAFQEGGGWLMLCSVRPDSLEGFNRLVGVKHLLRSFRMERVYLANADHPLAATLGDADVALYSTEAAASWRGLYYVSPNTFSYVIDGVDSAPFTFPPGAVHNPYVYKPTKDDKDPYNFVNGMTSADYWRYIRQIWVDKEADGGPVGLEHTFTLQRPETIGQVNLWNNAAYSTIENLEVVFDGDEANAVHTVLPDAAELTEIVLPQPRRAEKTITLKINSWRVRPHKNPAAKNLVGIDNVQFLRAKAPSAGVFLDNVGGLVAFPRGKGGVFLSQLKFMDPEPNAVNAPKKVHVLGVLLQNMGVGSRSNIVPVPGYNVRFEPLDLTDPSNVYRAEHEGQPGWFGRKGEDLRALPKGRNVFADVEYHVVDYGTAPVPDCIVLRAKQNNRDTDEEITGIPVGGKQADVLFLLHAADVSRPITDRERGRMNDRRRPFVLPALAECVLHYADGKESRLPIVLEKHVNHWLQDEPKSVDYGMLAWTSPLAAAAKSAVLYSTKLSNPRPKMPIQSLDIVLARDQNGRAQRRAAYGVVAVTLGTAVGK